VFSSRISDYQCGFKAITKSAAARLLPLIKNNEFFFDTELLIAAEKSGYRVLEIPVKWTENGDSRVRICKTAWEDVLGILRIYRASLREDGLNQKRPR
jgi:hypothetical protein